ncbi:hypothetical protein [Nonomuraea sp. NPDC049709]
MRWFIPALIAPDSFALHPIDTAAAAPAIGRVFPKRHTQLVMPWT